jgi:VWFA-related protein
MRSARFLAIFVLVCGITAGQTTPTHALPQNPPTMQPATSSATLTTKTRLVTIDVVVTNSHGNVVRDLKQDDFQVFDERSGPQKIARFAIVDTSANGAAAAHPTRPAGAPYVYSNVQSAPMRVSPTVILMDALNTSTFRQMQVRRDMTLFLKTIPADTPVAVFMLGHTVHMVQNFTTNPALLRAAVDRSGRPAINDRNPQDDPDSPSNVARDLNTGMPESALRALEDVEKEQYWEQMRDRVAETADAMKSIAKYLGGYPGRKNLIWFSESFPLWISPTEDFGNDPFAGTGSYEEKVREASYALTDARIAVYPVDARALDTSQAFSPASRTTGRNLGAGFGGALRREDDERIGSQATMDEVAEDTGGRTCKNTNDLAGCVARALDESSSYYELAYYPENVKWDGRFHKITIKTGQRGIKLAYRRGYFATDTPQSAKRDQPQKVLQDACADPLPSTLIALTAEAVPPNQTPGQPEETRYLLTISPGALSLGPVGGTRELNLQMAICEYNPKGDRFEIFPRDVSRKASDAVYQSWQAHGIRNIFDYDAKPQNQRLRFVVLDVPSGATGALDVPAHPSEFGSIPGSVISARPEAGSAPPIPVAPTRSQLVPLAPARETVTPQQQVTTRLTFRSSSGNASTLDWNAGKVEYHGDLGLELGASAFFQKFLGTQYHCQAGNLVPNEPGSTTVPRLAFVLQSAKGPAVLVDMTGTEPQYSGDLPVDPDGKIFFGEVWKLCHCQQP